MESTDFSSWLGRPPPVAMTEPPDPYDTKMQEAELDTEINDIVNEITVISDVGEDNYEAVVEQATVPDAEIEAAESSLGVEESVHDIDEAEDAGNDEEGGRRYLTLRVEIPYVEDKSDYEPLPGHSTVKRVMLRLDTPEGIRYKVKLCSGEINTVS